MLFGSLVPKVQRNTISTVSQEEIENLQSVYEYSFRQSFETTKLFITQCKHKGIKTLSSHLSNGPLYLKNPLNVYILALSQHRTTPEQAKIYIGNYFRANAQMTDLSKIDY